MVLRASALPFCLSSAHTTSVANTLGTLEPMVAADPQPGFAINHKKELLIGAYGYFLNRCGSLSTSGSDYRNPKPLNHVAAGFLQGVRFFWGDWARVHDFEFPLEA